MNEWISALGGPRAVIIGTIVILVLALIFTAIDIRSLKHKKDHDYDS